MRPTSLVVSVFNYGEHVGELLNMGDTVRMSLRIEAHFVKDGQKWYNEVTAFNIVSFR
jgi:hypothetical protein